MSEITLDQLKPVIRQILLSVNSRWMTKEETEQYIKGVRSLQFLREHGLCHSRVGGKVLFDRIEVDKLLESLKK